jgi:hypothetical protein
MDAKGQTTVTARVASDGGVRVKQKRQILFDGEPGRNRTFNPQIKSLLLCQLSYWPTRGEREIHAGGRAADANTR